MGVVVLNASRVMPEEREYLRDQVLLKSELPSLRVRICRGAVRHARP